ncbi:cytochrome P450 [Amycolatopsis mediterranei S699]|uniref:Cytochrome P450 n=3 Tax=Amycolatopsis mediterranei TaxID=33910 RepID=A0A0H3D6I9_AMYMU|nr:cytochrome P450 [Amycolatopsis mediterranei]ADJ45738.1 cytochrome P450 [Amycolatopsis mediterranei U32]AEK42520.1 cytochrome P450 [Amycolatopsis mediterranei S699]AFO77449.1 cytochrome P450 [Amycolatopsis mediterranei S699]AGT84577.1 cytochrome P450 [Amycolatopsis mediterranei RB]KDO05785.1 cytochrome P450 [Amycolatopsis mediterranei]
MSSEPVVDVRDPAVLDDPMRGYDRILAASPVCRARLPNGAEGWLVTGSAEVRAVLADPAVRNDPAGLPGQGAQTQEETFLALGTPREHLPYLRASLLSLDGAEHTRLRRSISHAFGASRVAALRPRVQQIVDALLDGLGEEADLLAEYAYPLAMAVVCEMVGVPEADWADWYRWGKVLVDGDPARITPTLGEMFAYCHALVDRRRAEPRADLLSEVVAQDDLTDVDAVALVVFLVLAGHETMAHMLANAALALMRDPAQRKLLREEPELWPAAIRELVRTDGPVQLARLRYAATDLEVGGVRIKAGDAVQAVLGAANRDPAQFAHPHAADVRRQAAHGGREGSVGFGWGPHFCLGVALAKLEAEVALRSLFERFPESEPVGDPAWVPLPRARHRVALAVRLR